MSDKEKCKEGMKKLLGPASADLVDNMEGGQCHQRCRKMIVDFMGEAKAEEFDKFMEG